MAVTSLPGSRTLAQDFSSIFFNSGPMKRWLAAVVLSGALSGTPALAQSAPWEQFSHHVSAVCRQITPAVVHVEVVSRRGAQRKKSLGSGLVVSAEGKIVTNFHVIDHAETVHVLLDDGSKYPATIVRQDKSTDLAVLLIHPNKPLTFLPLGDSDTAEVGEWVLAVGNPFGFDRTVSLGILSGKRRFLSDTEGDFRPINDFLQTDASIDPGSSGGPLVNLKGQVIGINSVGIGRGQGFTIPSKTVREVLEGSQVQGQLERGWLGLYPQPLTRELRDYWKFTGRGILVADVAPHSPAEAAGLRSGDIVTSLDGKPLDAEKAEEIQHFAQRVTRLAPGSKIRIGYSRRGQSDSVEVNLGQLPNPEGREVDSDFGATFAEVTLSDQLQYRLTVAQGVVVRSLTPNSPADWAGLAAGDLVLEADSQPIASLEQLKTLLLRKEARRPLLLKVRQGKLIHFALIERSGGQPP